MGWYGAGIMDGDTPMDWASKLIGILGLDGNKYRYNELSDVLRTALMTRQHMLVDAVRRETNSELRRIGWQVLGVMIMSQGASMSSAARGGVKDALAADEWAKHDLERSVFVREMLEIVESYSGSTPTKEYKDWEKEYGISANDMSNPQVSAKILRLAMWELADHLKSKKWYKGIRFALNNSGYRILLVISDADLQKGVHDIISDPDVPELLFDIPISFYINEQRTVAKRGDKIADDL